MKRLPAILGLSLTLVSASAVASAQCTSWFLHGPSTTTAFGISLSEANGRILVGSMYDAELGVESGAALVYEPSAAGFRRETLRPLAPRHDGRFGQSVAMVGEQALVGALDDEFGVAAGAVFVHERGSGAWRVTQKLAASDARAGGNFGVAMARSGERIVVGASGSGGDRGAAYVFERQGDRWQEIAVLRPTSTQAYSAFGCAVAIDGGRVVVGAYGAAVFPTPPGMAFVFEEAGGAWVESQRLQPAGSGALDFFGTAVAVSGDRIAVGAMGENAFATPAGAVHLYERSPGGWASTARLTGSAASRAAFGQSLSFEGDRLAVGAGPSWVASSATRYVETFTGAGAAWASEGHHLGAGSGFGMSTLLHEGLLLVGGDADSGVDAVRVIGVAREAQLLGSHGELSLSAQDEQWLALAACPQLAGAPYRILGSLSGDGPFTVGGVAIPLSFDRYTRQTLLQPSLTLTAGLGTLDATGRAQASVRLAGAHHAAFVGLTLRHAAVVLDGAGLPRTATNAVDVIVVP